MDAFTPLSAAGGSQPAAPTPAVAASDRIKATAQKFEASFLSVMVGAMFEGVSSDGPFGGGQGEAAFRSFLSEEMAKGVAKHGGVGLSAAVQREMLKIQGAPA